MCSSDLVPCPKCGDKKSKPEMELADFLKIFTVVTQRDRKILKPKELDVVLPKHNLAVEMHGMFFHTHWNHQDELKNKLNTYAKYKACAEQNIRLITVYESEWVQRKPQIKRLLRNAIGATKGKIMARKCDLGMVGVGVAKTFFDA